MRETVRSLRAYFVFLGLVSIGQVALALSQARAIPVAIEAFDVLFGLAFLVAAARLPYLLQRHSWWLIGLVWVSIGFHMSVPSLAGLRPFSLVHLVLVVVLGLYVTRSVRRLAAEMTAPRRPAV